MSNITQITGNISSEVVIDVNSIKGIDDKIANANNPHIASRFVSTMIVALTIIVVALSIFVINIYCSNYKFDGESAGILISSLTVLVTALVAWQIYSTIKAKEELKEVKSLYEQRLKALETKVERLNNKQSKIEGKEDAMQAQEISLAGILNTKAYELAQRDILIHGTNLYNWLFEIIDATMSIDDIYAKYLEIKEKHPSKVSFINGRDATRNEVLETIDMVRPIKLTLLRVTNKD